MAERENTYPDGSYPNWTDYDWAQGPGQHGVTQPAAGMRQVGYDDDEIPTNDHWNDILQRLGNALRWLGIVVPREFSTLAEALTPVYDSYMFRVHAHPGGWRQRGAVVFNTQGTGGANAVVGMATDGQRIYYGQTDYCYATSPASLTSEWSTQLSSGKNVIDIAADGLNVYVLIETLEPGDEVSLLTPSTGVKRDGASITTPSCTCLDANGTFLVVAQTATVHFYNGLAGTLNNTGTFDNTQTIVRLCIGNRRVYTVATGGTGYMIVRAVDLVTRTQDWSKDNTLWGASANFDANWICTDSDRVYMVSDRVALTAGGYANVWCVSAQYGNLLWTADLTGAAVNPERCAVDDRVLYVSEEHEEETWALDKRDGFVLWNTANVSIAACDGLSWCGTDFLNNVTRNWRGGPSRHFLRCNGADDERRPFFNLAVPINEGV